MNIEVTDKAFDWFKNELDVTSGDQIQFFVRYGGDSDFQEGFSIGVIKKEKDDPSVEVKKESVVFYIEKKDEWYFDNKDFLVEFNEDIQEIQYKHKK